MSDLLTGTHGEPTYLLAAAGMMGLSVMLFLWSTMRGVAKRAAPVGALIDETQRALRRPPDGEESGLASLAQAMMPLFRPLARALPLPSLRDSVVDRYAAAGWPGGFSDDEVYATSLMVGVLLGIPLALVLTVVHPLLAPFAAIALVLGPGLVSAHYSGEAQARRLEIARTMPFVLDLLVLAMRAGAPLRIALQRAALDNAENAVGVELRALLADMETGVTTRDAFVNMATRAPVPVIRLFVDEVVQAEELGRPVAEALEHLADRVRVSRVQDAVETAGKARVKVLAPGMLILFASLILLFAPFALRFFYGGSPTD